MNNIKNKMNTNVRLITLCCVWVLLGGCSATDNIVASNQQQKGCYYSDVLYPEGVKMLQNNQQRQCRQSELGDSEWQNLE